MGSNPAAPTNEIKGSRDFRDAENLTKYLLVTTSGSRNQRSITRRGQFRIKRGSTVRDSVRM